MFQKVAATYFENGQRWPVVASGGSVVLTFPKRAKLRLEMRLKPTLTGYRFLLLHLGCPRRPTAPGRYAGPQEAGHLHPSGLPPADRLSFPFSGSDGWLTSRRARVDPCPSWDRVASFVVFCSRRRAAELQRRSNRQVTNAIPCWRLAMSEVFEAGQRLGQCPLRSARYSGTINVVESATALLLRNTMAY